MTIFINIIFFFFFSYSSFSVVPGHVLAVLGELDREAVVRALVHAGDVPLDDQARLEVEALEASQRLRI